MAQAERALRRLDMIRSSPLGRRLIVVSPPDKSACRHGRASRSHPVTTSCLLRIEFGDAFDYTGADFAEWCTEVGFGAVEVVPLTGPTSAGIAFK